MNRTQIYSYLSQVHDLERKGKRNESILKFTPIKNFPLTETDSQITQHDENFILKYDI